MTTQPLTTKKARKIARELAVIRQQHETEKLYNQIERELKQFGTKREGLFSRMIHWIDLGIGEELAAAAVSYGAGSGYYDSVKTDLEEKLAFLARGIEELDRITDKFSEETWAIWWARKVR